MNTRSSSAAASHATTPVAGRAANQRGVIGMIRPWNWPINQTLIKVIPALATGCSSVNRSFHRPISSLKSSTRPAFQKAAEIALQVPKMLGR
jgi:acyl-CoA reductase-like NAD-dependent aldehyde dehydrogenase